MSGPIFVFTRLSHWSSMGIIINSFIHNQSPSLKIYSMLHKIILLINICDTLTFDIALLRPVDHQYLYIVLLLIVIEQRTSV